MNTSLAALLSVFDHAGRCFEAVHMARMIAADYGMTASEAFCDRAGLGIVDSLPTVDVYDTEPATLRSVKVAA